MNDDNIKEIREKKLQIKIIVEPEIGQGKFSNMANISHSIEEFSLDFMYINPSPPAFGKMVSRVIMTPGHLKRFFTALQDNLAKYEEKFGEIKIKEDPNLDVGKIN